MKINNEIIYIATFILAHRQENEYHMNSSSKIANIFLKYNSSFFMKITWIKKFALPNFSEARDSNRAEHRPRVRLVFSVALKLMLTTTTAGRGPNLPGEPEVVVGVTLPRSRWCRVKHGRSWTTWRPRPQPWKTWALRMSRQRGNPQSGGRQGLLATTKAKKLIYFQAKLSKIY